MLFRFLVLWLCFGVGPAVLLFRRGDVPGTLVQLLEEEEVWSNFCQQHYNELSQDGVHNLFHNEMSDMFEAAKKWFEEQQLQMVVEMSQRDTEERQRRHEASVRIVERRLASKGLQRVSTPADGNCLFIAAAWSAGIHIDPFALRQQVVSYLRTYSSLFSQWFDTQWASFSHYCDAMSRGGTWGDDLVVMALSHLLLRPVPLFSKNTFVLFPVIKHIWWQS